MNKHDVNSKESNLLKNLDGSSTETKNSSTLRTAGKKKVLAKRQKPIIDDVKEIDSNTMKEQISNTSGILGSLDMAPPNSLLMYMREYDTADKLFSITSRPLRNKLLQKVKFFSINLQNKTIKL